jgi:sialic acid synthase SpsE
VTGSGSALHIIAEAGTNHGGKLELGRRLVDIGAAGGADSIKFQVIYPEGLYLPRFYRDGRYEDSEVYQRRERGQLSDQDLERLAAYSRERRLAFGASVFDRRGLDLLDRLDADYIKIASCDLNHSALLRAAAERGRRLIVSTGMSSLGEIERAVVELSRGGAPELVLMHCVSVYPCPTALMNLGFLEVLHQAFGLPLGLSDHTEEALAATVAVAKGVVWIEKHITYDRAAEGFDHAYAMEPAAFQEYVAQVRRAAEANRVRWPKVGPEEETVKARARRALYAACDLQAGEVLSADQVLVVRPAGPLEPDALPGLLGRPTLRPIRRYEALRREWFG